MTRFFTLVVTALGAIGMGTPRVDGGSPPWPASDGRMVRIQWPSDVVSEPLLRSIRETYPCRFLDNTDDFYLMVNPVFDTSPRKLFHGRSNRRELETLAQAVVGIDRLTAILRRPYGDLFRAFEEELPATCRNVHDEADLLEQVAHDMTQRDQPHREVILVTIDESCGVVSKEGAARIELRVWLKIFRIRVLYDPDSGLKRIVGSELIFADCANGWAERTGDTPEQVLEDLEAATYDALRNGLALSLFCNPFLRMKPWKESRGSLDQVVGPSLSESIRLDVDR